MLALIDAAFIARFLFFAAIWWVAALLGSQVLFAAVRSISLNIWSWEVVFKLPEFWKRRERLFTAVNKGKGRLLLSAFGRRLDDVGQVYLQLLDPLLIVVQPILFLLLYIGIFQTMKLAVVGFGLMIVLFPALFFSVKYPFTADKASPELLWETGIDRRFYTGFLASSLLVAALAGWFRFEKLQNSMPLCLEANGRVQIAQLFGSTGAGMIFLENSSENRFVFLPYGMIERVSPWPCHQFD